MRADNSSEKKLVFSMAICYNISMTVAGNVMYGEKVQEKTF